MTMQQQIDWLAKDVGGPALDYEPAPEPRMEAKYNGGDEVVG
jgi:hypothetical protein